MDRQHLFELAVPVSAMDHLLGPDHAPLTIVEYGDFECPNCQQAAPAVKLILKRHENRVRFVFRHFPLEEVHPHALLAAEATEAAGAQGRFWAMHDLLFDHFGELQPSQLRARAQQLNLDLARFDAELDDEIYRQRVREHQAGGRTSGVHGTPAFFVDGKLFDVSFGMRALAERVSALLGN